MDTSALDHVRALISRTRVPEMKSRGWRVVAPGEEGSVMMEGPQLGGGPAMAGQPSAGQYSATQHSAELPVGTLFESLVARALERADAADRAERARRAA